MMSTMTALRSWDVMTNEFATDAEELAALGLAIRRSQRWRSTREKRQLNQCVIAQYPRRGRVNIVTEPCKTRGSDRVAFPCPSLRGAPAR